MSSSFSWWTELPTLGRFLAGGAAFFSVLMVWQLAATITGLSADGADADGDGVPDDLSDSDATVSAFRLLSIRSIVAFFTLFFWAGTLYLRDGAATTRALLYATLWGLAGWFAIGLLMRYLPRLADSGAKDASTCVGETGTVYLDIPANGVGQVRVPVGGVLVHLSARAKGGAAIPAQTPVRVVRMLDTRSVEVERV